MTSIKEEKFNDEKRKMIQNITAPLVLTVLLSFFSGVLLMTNSLFAISVFIVLLGVSLYWLIRRIEND
jgi:hypothetical protein